jgi:hypothetical protein
MIQTGFESRIKVQQIIENQLPGFILDESPKAAEFLKQYYISQEYQGGPVDIVENLDQYLNLDNLIPEVIVGSTGLTTDISSSSGIVTVTSTKGFPPTYGLLKIDDEIITYTGLTTNTFTGCVRGFSGITSYHQDLNSEELVFSQSISTSHSKNSKVINLSSQFLQEFYKKLKYTLTPGFENVNFVSDLHVGNFIKESKTLYQTKGTDESFRILFNVLYGETPKVIDLEQFLIKPSAAKYVRREVMVAERISGDPSLLVGQTIRKSTDENTTASVSEVEIIKRGAKNYYKLLIFIGYDDAFPTVTGTFNITGNTRVLEDAEPNANIITVDSTIGFGQTGTIYIGNNEVTYNNKSINQFFGCTGIGTTVKATNIVRSDETYYGYENGDLSKKVEFRLTGVLSKFSPTLQLGISDENDQIGIKYLGEIIKNPIENASKEEIFANSWIYNTSSRYQIESFNSGSISQVLLSGTIDKSSLKVGDKINILERDSEILVASNLTVLEITNNQVSTSNNFTLNQNKDYDIRRIINFSSATENSTSLEYSSLFADIQNVYIDDKDGYFYVASNSLPSYEIDKKTFSYIASSVSDKDIETGLYSIINFEEKVSFLTGSEIFYQPEITSISGMAKGIYYVEVLSNKSQIRLYTSKTFIGSGDYIQFGELTPGNHLFVLNSQSDNIISAQKILRKFPINTNIADGLSDLTDPGSVGMLINGVEVTSYKSNEKIYYGPIKEVDILNGGKNYDVINPPLLQISSGIASVQPIVRGSIKRIFVDPQDFNIDTLVSIAVTGGNGRGASFEPFVEIQRREIKFDSRQTTSGGGVDINSETITFLSSHYLSNGQPIYYNPGDNTPLGIGTFNASNVDQSRTLKNGGVYYTKVINDTTIQLYERIFDYRSGINTVGFTESQTSGIHVFKTEPKKVLTDIKVINGGSGYENRKLRVNSAGISTINHTVTFENHGFNHGELIVYDYETSAISGLSSSKQYYILKIDDNKFRLSDAGIGGTSTSDYQREKYVKFGTTGSGYQIFNYPPIIAKVEYSTSGVGSTSIRGTITANPSVKGEIVGTYVYNTGSDYGSTIINLHKKPTISVKNGKNAQVNPVIVDGRIIDTNLQYGGIEYYSIPDLKVVGSGSGCILRPVILNNKLVDVIVITSGSGYDENTKIIVESSGKNAIFDIKIRPLEINNNFFYATEDLFSNFRKTSNELLINSKNNLQYFISGYSQLIQNEFNDIGLNHSPIIGWAYDGNPIYGSYGYTDPNDKNSPIKRLSSGYTANTSNIENRPEDFDLGFFVDDYKFTSSGDLDVYNGRFCMTPEFPNGVYAYFATSEPDIYGNIVGQFPYFVGNYYRSKFISDNNKLDQSFDFNNSKLIRNTFPYKVNDKYGGNDFIIESNEIINQKTNIESVTSGSVSNFNIIESGNDYKVGDNLNFKGIEINGDGGGIIAQVSKLKGKDIVNLQTNLTSYYDAVFNWKDGNQVEVSILPYHSIENFDTVTISGFSTTLSDLNGSYQVGVTSYTSILIKDMPAYSPTGIVTDIYVSRIPDNISVGSSIGIGTEILSVLNIFNDLNVLRTVRQTVGLAHTSTTIVNFIPNSFTINHKTDYFDSKLNKEVYFNPKQSVGIGTTTGIGIPLTYTVGNKNYQISVPTQSIFLPNHPFETNQEVIFKKLSSSNPLYVSNTETSGLYTLPISGNQQTVYIIKKSKDYIGIVTQVGLTTTTNGLFFQNNGTDDYRYSIKSAYSQVTGNIDKIKTLVSVSTAHNLSDGDTISLDLIPNLSVGIGTSTSIFVKYDTSTERLLINPIGFTTSGINTSTNSITLPSHNLNTGDKVLYSSNGSTAQGLSTGFYFVYKVDNNKIKLCETRIDSISIPPNVVDIVGIGTTNQTISLINPKIDVVKNNNLIFNLSDTSLSGYNFKIYYDKDFADEFVSTGSTNIFSISGFGTVGVSTNATLTLNYSEGFPTKLYYSLEKSGYISTADKEVKNYSQINFVNSIYNGDYTISGLGETTFNIVLTNIPEKLSYNQSECYTLEYSTNSSSSSGGIKNIKLISGGNGFKKLPVFNGSDSENGNGAYIICESDSIGKINQTKILNEGFEYSSDKTLKPKANIPSVVNLSTSNTISSISVLNSGKNYTYAPTLIIVDSDTGKKIDSGFLSPKLIGSGIASVDIVNEPKGLPSTTVKIKSINNTNGVGIQTISTSNTGIATCTLVTPLSGFNIEPFAIGDKIFVEGIQQYNSDGDGFNSENYGYEFFTVTGYTNAGTYEPRQLTFSVAGFTTNPGIAKTTQNSYGLIINYNNYPQFEVTQKLSTFIVGESLSVLINGQFVKIDLKITQYNNTSIKVQGNYDLSDNDVIRGVQSGSIATVNSIIKNYGEFDISYSSKQNLGWSDNIGNLDEDVQVISDNDYYQNLSYSLKSSQTWDTIVSPINNILHPTGLKNFADTEIISSTGFASTNTFEYTSILYDIFNENRVDTINNFDLVLDVDLSADGSSKFLKFKNKRLSDYIQCRTNRTLLVDDISSEFSSSELDSGTYSNISDIITSKKYERFLVQISDTQNTKFQFSEIITINDNNDIFTLEKGSIATKNTRLADIYGYVDEVKNFYLKFVPEDVYNTDYNIKVLSNTFDNYLTGIGTYSVGFVNLVSSNSVVGVGSTATIISAPIGNLNSIFSNVHIINNNASYEMNYVELYVDHDGTNTNISEYYFDSEVQYSGNFIGSFAASISNNIITLNYTNTSNNPVTLRSKNVGFGTTSIGGSAYRFQSIGQPNGSERTVNYISDYSKVSTASTIVSLDKTNFSSLKSTIKVSIGNTSALHQVMMIHDGNNVYTTQYPSLSIGSTSGIGTFGGEYSGNYVNLKFYPDPTISGTLTVLTFNECFYKELDLINVPINLTYANITESVKSQRYISINSNYKNKLDFDLKYQGYPIFEKIFDPTNTNTLNYSTGEFSIPNHFFSTGEELIYTPSSSFIGIAATSVGIGSTLTSSGIVTNRLPSKVFAIKINNGKFKLSTRKDYAEAGIYVTFTSVGTGNYHKLEMFKKNEKSIITIDSMIQHPLNYSLVHHTLNNGGQIGTASTVFALSGISSIAPGNILKIEDEYMKVSNVGLATTSSGPITFSGNVPLVEVVRGFAGTSNSTHNNGTDVKVYTGSFNIVGSKIYFTEAPRGKLIDDNDLDNLPNAKSTFDARVFLKNDYSSNQIYDDISTTFTGIGQTYPLTSQGIATVGLSSIGGNGIVVINGMFQTPTTQNNSNNNYTIIEDSVSGISSIVFSGITSSNGSIVISDYDINRNQLPRGGMIVSLGSTPGLGFAPLVGASVTAIVSGGSIISVGIGTSGNYGSGYRNPVSIAVTDSSHTGTAATITATVGAGGTLSFNIIGGGTGYVNPKINISSPSYENLSVTGVSRLGIGTTTETGVGLLLNVEVGASSTVGVGSTLFQVTSFKITRPGYAFKRGDVLKPVGLVTAKGLASPLSDFTLTVLDTFTDSFAAWKFGELDYIDSIKSLQDGTRVRYPLYYNEQLLSFEKDSTNPDSQAIDFDSLLIIFINGILQKPGVAYQFSGGTSFTFTTPPKESDNVAIFFYRGSNSDSTAVDINETVKEGDELQVFNNNNLLDITTTQDPRIITNIKTSDTIETNTYKLQGIDVVNLKPTSWIKQKVDRFIDGSIISKSRDSLEPQIYPTAKIIRNFQSTDTGVFVDNSEFFNYENEISIDFDAFIVSGKSDPVSAAVTAIVSAAGTIQSLSITNAGSGYTGSSVTVKISPPLTIGISTSLPMGVGIGIGTTATATITVSAAGTLTTPIVVTNPGLGYSIGMPPQVITPLPKPIYENVTNITNIQGFSGNIIGIGTTVGIGTNLAIKFTLDPTLSPFTGLAVGYPIYIFNSKVGNGVTSIIDKDSSIVGVGTTFLDNIYYINAFSSLTGIITCNVKSTTSVVGIATTGPRVAQFSWGRIFGFTRSSSPISIAVSSYTVDAGLSTFPTIQRRGYGLRTIGALKKIL